LAYKIQYSLLDTPEITEYVFYPRKDWTEPPPGATDHLVRVEESVSVSCRFYKSERAYVSFLLFHGNGEVASDYDWIAPIYNGEGINLFVADYRGYGLSGGKPTFSSMVEDCNLVFHYFCSLLSASSNEGPLLVMGRSLGSDCALELAAKYPGDVGGLILESGSSNPGRLLRRFSIPVPHSTLDNLERASLERVKSINVPVLVIHGEFDALIPVSHAVDFYENVGAKAKELVIIPGAGHNDLLFIGMEQYFSAIREFVLRHARRGG